MCCSTAACSCCSTYYSPSTGINKIVQQQYYFIQKSCPSRGGGCSCWAGCSAELLLPGYSLGCSLLVAWMELVGPPRKIFIIPPPPPPPLNVCTFVLRTTTSSSAHTFCRRKKNERQNSKLVAWTACCICEAI